MGILPEDTAKRGIIAAVVTFVLWGAMPLFWQLLREVSPLEIIAQRIIWSFVVVFLLLVWKQQLGSVLLLLKNTRAILLLALSGSLLAGNWLLYVWAVNNGHVLDSSLGYYINPLINILVGSIFFHDKTSRLSWCAIALAAAGVMYQIIALGVIPFIALALATSFAAYAVIRKVVVVQALQGLFIETSLMLLPALAYMGYLLYTKESAVYLASPSLHATLLSLGIVTTVPLVLFTYAARNISLTLVGLIQYVAPSTSFVLGIVFFKESLSFAGMVTFVCIWCALALYAVDSFAQLRRRSRASAE